MGSAATRRDHLVHELKDLTEAEEKLRRRRRKLMQTLKEQKAADKKLTSNAKGSANRRASKASNKRTNDSMLAKGARWIGLTAGRAVNTVIPRIVASEDSGARRAPSAKRSRSRSRTKSG